MHYCSQEKKTGAILFLGEGKRCTAVIRRRNLVLFCFQVKVSGALLLSGGRNWFTTVLK